MFWDSQRQAFLFADGQPWPRAEQVRALRQLAELTTRTLTEVLQLHKAGKITVTEAERLGINILRLYYNINSALAWGGWAQTPTSTWGRNGALLRNEYRYWRQFVAESSSLSAEQSAARAALYAGRAYARFFDEERRRLSQSGVLSPSWERWSALGDAVTCADCLALAALAWVPFGTLPTVPGAGATRCLGACRCEIIYAYTVEAPDESELERST